MSNKRRATYYKQKDKLPQKYCKPSFIFDKKGRLTYRGGEPIIKNIRSVGTPKYKKINGQEFYAGVGSPIIRVKVVNAIKDFFRPFLKGIKPITEFPVCIDCHYYDVPGPANWDLDNKWIYTKVFQDLLVQEGILPDDNIKYVSRAASMEYYPVETTEERKLVFSIYKDERKHNIFYE
jgi:hypothetical protein